MTRNTETLSVLDVTTPRHPGLKWALIGLATLAAIIVPFVLFGARVDAWTVGLIEGPRQHPAIVSLLLGGMLGSDILLPVPSSIVSTACGIFLGFFVGTMVSWVGMVVSCCLGYLLALRLGRPFVSRMVGRRSMSHFEHLQKHYGDWVVVLARPIPVVAEISVLVAGLGRMPFWRFFWLSSFSNLGISMVYAGIGAFSVNLNAFLPAVAGSVLIPGLGMLWVRWRSALRSRAGGDVTA